MNPKPGSDEALEMGCTCPIYDNMRGKGAYGGPEGAFYISLECPLHGKEADGKR